MEKISDIKKINEILMKHEKRISDLENMLKKEDKRKEIDTAKPVSVSGLIEGLKDEGFFNVPRSLKEIKNELARNNYHYAVTSLTNPLQRLVRQRILGRILQNGKWAYVKR